MADESPISVAVILQNVIAGGNIQIEKIQQIVYENVAPRPVDSATLAAAQQQFGQLPLEVIPDIAPLPPGSRIFFRSNPFFVGRTSDLQRLAALLKGQEGDLNTSLPAIVLTGLGGVGKTQLASEFVHRYGRYFAGGVFWLSFAEPASIPAEIAGCWPSLGKEVPLNTASLPLSEQVQLVLGAWQNALPRLLIFDNCEDEKLLDRWRPPSGGCRILLTSRRDSWSPSLGVSIHPLGGLPRQESIALLSKYRSDLAQEEADAITNEVGDLPLALHVAGSFLATYRTTRLGTPARYLEQLRQIPLSSLQGRGATHSPTQHELNIERTFAVSYNRLDLTNAIDQQALNILARAAYFAPGEAIPRRLLSATLQKGETDLQEELLFEDGLLRLGALGLLQRQDQEMFRLHRLLASFVQLRLGATGHKAQRAVEETFLNLEAPSIEINDLKQMLTVQRHLYTITERAMPRRNERALALCSKLIAYLIKIGSYTEATRYGQWFLKIHEQRLGTDHPDTADALNNLGVIYNAQGHYKEAETVYRRALAILEKKLGKDPLLSAVLNNQAEVYRAQERYEEAEPLYKRALAILEKELGKDHPRRATTLNNLGLLYDAQGRDEEAEALYKEALVIQEKKLGRGHPDTANGLNNLGLLYDAQGRDEEAEALYKEALVLQP